MYIYHFNTRFEVDNYILGNSGEDYELQEVINCGGNGIVHRCVDMSSGEEYAIKFQVMLKPKRVKRFRQELDFMRSARHSQLMYAVDEGTIRAKQRNGRSTKLPFVVMPLAEDNLATYLKESVSVNYETYIGQFLGLSEALAEMHSKITHRDIKPENILVRGSTWYLADFGLCEYLDDQSQLGLTIDGELIGPKLWMSPEAINSGFGNMDTIEPKSDVFQLASVFWYVVTGRHPTGCVTENDWSGPQELYALFRSCLSHDPSSRPQNGTEFHDQLKMAVESAMT
jgi:serine/threonine-protein kinase